MIATPSSPYHTTHPRAIAYWLFACAFSVVLMVVIGGLTRLTDSGLSIVTWEPFTGIFPPFTEIAWQELFRAYQGFPEYLLINRDMTLEGFKQIFWLEYLHRLLGRMVGCIFFLPFLYFTFKRAFDLRQWVKLFVVFLLGGFQGFLGWYMVKSGLVDRPDVNHYRLAMHLTLACFLLAILLQMALHYYYTITPKELASAALQRKKTLQSWAKFTIYALFIQIITGAFMAGLDAGMIYNSYPLMEGQFIPDSIWWFSPWYRNLGENVTTVQFLHRNFALVVASMVLFLAFSLQKQARISNNAAMARPLHVIAWVLYFVILLQFSLGIATLLYQVPVVLAALHQLGAVILLSVLVITHHFIASCGCISASDTTMSCKAKAAFIL